MFTAFLLGFCVAAAEAAGPPAPPSFAEICHQDVSPEAAFPSVEQMRKLLGQVAGHECVFERAHHHDRQFCQARGLFRLNEPWRPDTALRMSLMTWRWYRVYLWNGQQGVALLHYVQWNGTVAWAAYAVTRTGDKPLPEQWSLVATDENRFQQVGVGPFMIVHHDERVILTRGDVVLLSAPMKKLPTEVFFDLDARTHGIEFVACRGGPPLPSMPPIVAKLDKPAAAEWKLEAGENTGLHLMPDGAIEWRGKAKSPGGKARAIVCEPGPEIFCFEVEDATRATGVFVADAEGQEICRVAFCADQNKPDLVFRLVEGGNNETTQWIDLNSYPVCYAGKSQWVQIVVGWDVCKLAVSADGQQWSQYFQTVKRKGGPATQVGVYSTPHHDKDQSIRLRSVQVRRFQHLPVAPNENRLAERMDELVAGPGDLAVKLQSLDSVARMVDTHDNHIVGLLAAAYRQLADRTIREGQAAPFSAITSAVNRLSCSQRLFHRVNWEDALVAEVVPLMYARRWPEVRAISERVRSWQDIRFYTEALPGEERGLFDLSDWIGAMLPRQLALPRRERSDGMPYRQMFMPAPSKEGFNALSELLGAVQSQAYREACQAITGQSNPASLGLAPDPQDPRLYYAYPVAVRMLIERVGELRRTMNDEFARLGELRLKAALADGDREGMVSVALQFVGTPAAAEARRWLGDQAVSSGHFDEAVGHYRHAMRDAAADARSPLAARIRLAEAFRGAEAGSPVGAAVQLGALELPAARFEQLVGETRKARADEGLIATSSQSGPPCGDYTARSIGRLDGTSKPERGASPGIDWGARQMAAGYSSRSLLLSDIASMAAWQFDDGKELWKQGLREGDKNRLPMTGVRPAVAADRVFVRRTMREKADLACFSLNDGQPLWSVLPDDAVVSDPLVSGQNVFVFTVRKSFPQKLVLSLCRLTADSGDTVIVQPVAELLDMWGGELPCRAALIDDMLVATAGGAVLCCHQDGTVQWVRQQVWMPSRDAEQQSRPWFSGQHEPPLTFDDRVLAFQPGMKGLECLDLLSGQLVWQRTLPQIDRVVGVVADRVVVRAGHELIGLEGATGAVAWRHATADVAEALLCGPSGVVYVKREEHKDEKAPRRPVMVWLDAKNGQAMGESPVEGISQSKPLFGPLLAAGDRAWLVVATEDKPQERTLWELKRR